MILFVVFTSLALFSQALARTPRNCGLACNSVKKCLAVLDGSGGNRPGQLGNTGIIVLETCAPKLEKARKKGCTCEAEVDDSQDSRETERFHSATQKSARTSSRGRHAATTEETTTSTRRTGSRFSNRSRPGTERATSSISRPALRSFRPSSLPSTSSSFSTSSSVSTSTSSVRTPRRNLFGSGSDRRRILAERFRRRY